MLGRTPDVQAGADDMTSSYEMNEEILDTKMAASLLCCSDRTVENWRKKGTGPPYTALINGRPVRPGEKPKQVIYLRSEVLEWIRDGMIDPRKASADADQAG
jgi:hypothetical protein